MEKLFRNLLGLIAALITLSVFAGLAYYVSDEGSTMGYIATGLFALMGILGAFVAFAWIVIEDKTPGGISQHKEKDQIDPVMMGAPRGINLGTGKKLLTLENDSAVHHKKRRRIKRRRIMVL